jgi:hypothetical protein
VEQAPAALDGLGYWSAELFSLGWRYPQQHNHARENQMAESNLHTTASLETRETASLIGSDKVEGTAVYRSNGDKMLDVWSGHLLAAAICAYC